jgi:putative FmdB family regulatory protein
VPTYEYQCSKCNSTYELRQGFDAPTEHVCEECGKGTAKRVLHAPRVLFKGSGFYVTDSKSKSSAAADSSSVTDGKSEGSATSSDEKAAPKAAETAAPVADTSASG